MKITFPSGAREVPHKDVTLRNAEILNGWADKIKTKIRQGNQAEMTRYFVKLTKDHPELAELLDMDGSWNPQEFERRMQGYRDFHNRAIEETGEEVEFDEERYAAKVREDMKQAMQRLLKDTPVIAKMMHFVVPAYPADIHSLPMGIECIKACAKAEALDGITDDDWQDVSAAEVADWVTNFCNAIA